MKKIICVVWMMFALIVAGCSQVQDKFPEDSFYSALGVKFEYVDDDGYIFVNRANGYPMIMFFPNVSRNIEKTDEAFEGDWIYRLTYNWNGYCVGCEETIVFLLTILCGFILMTAKEKKIHHLSMIQQVRITKNDSKTLVFRIWHTR